jgi:hypothetical protein
MAACATATNPEWNMLPIRRDVGKPVFQKDVVAKQWITDNSEERKAELLAGFRRSAFVDGVLHVPSDGPALSVFSRTATSPEDNAATAEQFVLGVFPEPGAFPPYRHSTANRIFTIAEVDEAEIEALRTRDQAEQDARRLRRRHTILPGIERDGILDVFIADAGNLDHRKSLECDRIEGLFREVRPVLADLDPQAIRRFADLKSEWMTNNGWTVARLALFADDLVELLPGRSHSL